MSQSEFVDQAAEQFTVFGGVDRVDAGADDRHAGLFQTTSQVERRLATELNDHTIGLHRIADVQHVFDRQRFEEQDVRCVVVGADRFRVAVDHDRFDAHFLQGKRSVAAAIIELDALADSVGATTQNDDPFLVALGGDFGFGFVGAVVVRREGFEFSRTRVDTFVDRTDAHFQAFCSDLRFRFRRDRCNLAIRESATFGVSHRVRVDPVQLADRTKIVFGFDQLLQVIQEPRVDVGQRMNLRRRHSVFECVADVEDSLGTGSRQLRTDFVAVWLIFGSPKILWVTAKSERADFQTTQGFLERFLKRPSDRHGFADRLHLCCQRCVGFGKFLECESRHFGDDVIDRRLEAGFGFLRDVVGQFPQTISDRQFRSDLCNRETGRFTGQGRTATDSRVHFNHDHPARVRLDRELNVTASGFDTDLANDGQRCVTHPLVFFV